MQFGHGRIIKNHTGAEAGTQFSQNRRFHFGVNFRTPFWVLKWVGISWFSRPGGRDGLGPLPWRPQEPSERSQEPSQEASRAVREPSRAAQEASRVVWATSTSRPGGPRPSQAASAAARKGPEAPKEASNGIRERSQSPQSHGPTFSAHTARPIRTKGGFPNRGGRGGVNPSPKYRNTGKKQGWKEEEKDQNSRRRGPSTARSADYILSQEYY